MWNYLVPASICDLIGILKLSKIKKINKPGTYYSHKGFTLYVPRGKVGVIFKHTHREKRHIELGYMFMSQKISQIITIESQQ